MNPRYRPILPAGAPTTVPESSASGSRTVVSAACDACRGRKCDRHRPVCGRCLRTESACNYETVEGESRGRAIKRKYSIIQEEANHFKHIFELLHRRPYQEALEIFNRIRLIADPLQVLQLVKDAALLLPLQLDALSGASDARDIDAEAWEQSEIKVPSRPWTLVVGDGIVSELISSFFATDHGYLVPMVHQHSFLADMKGQDMQTSESCSATLVNSICALKCLTSPRAMKMGNLTDPHHTIAETFLGESKRLLELEHGRQSIPTVISLCLMYFTSAHLGRDRVGATYRYMAYAMAKRLRLEQKFAKLEQEEPNQILPMSILSKMLWGLFCFESRVSYLYSEPSLVAQPTVPRLFSEQDEQNDGDSQLSIESLYRKTPGAFDALCSLSDLGCQIMAYNYNVFPTNRGPSDYLKRDQFYSTLTGWYSSLPERLHAEENFTAQTCHLHNHFSETALGILQLLPRNHYLDGERENVKELTLWHCKVGAELMEHYLQNLTPDPVLARTLFALLSALVPYLEDVRSQGLFTRISIMLQACAHVAPLVKFMLLGIHASVRSLEMLTPEDAKQYYEKLGDGVDMDIPIGFALTYSDDIRYLLSGGTDENDGQIGVDLSTLLSRWPQSPRE